MNRGLLLWETVDVTYKLEKDKAVTRELSASFSRCLETGTRIKLQIEQKN